MRHSRGRSKNRIKVRGRSLYIVIGALVVAVAVLVVCLVGKGAEAIMDVGHVAVDMRHDAVIVRRETAVTTNNFDRADYLVREGENISAGEHVMDVYNRGFNDELMLSLQQTRREIYEAQLEQMGETRDSTVRGYNERVELIKSNIANAVMEGNTASVPALERELFTALSERSAYLRSILQETEKLRTLYRTEQEKEALISVWRNSLYAETAGTVSFYFDDYENALNAEKLGMLTSDLISTVLKGKGAVEWTTQAENLAYRVVDTSNWFLVYLTGAEDTLRSAQGKSYVVELDGYGTYTATAREPIISGKYALNILEVNAEMGELINVRTVGIDVHYEADGVTVRAEGIIIKDGRYYIDLMYSDGKERVEINALASNGDKVIISVRDGGEHAIVAGVRYWIP